jgi:hypothetical protein
MSRGNLVQYGGVDEHFEQSLAFSAYRLSRRDVLSSELAGIVKRLQLIHEPFPRGDDQFQVKSLKSSQI